jgi:hypothetical protein
MQKLVIYININILQTISPWAFPFWGDGCLRSLGRWFSTCWVFWKISGGSASHVCQGSCFMFTWYLWLLSVCVCVCVCVCLSLSLSLLFVSHYNFSVLLYKRVLAQYLCTLIALLCVVVALWDSFFCGSQNAHAKHELLML